MKYLETQGVPDLVTKNDALPALLLVRAIKPSTIIYNPQMTLAEFLKAKWEMPIAWWSSDYCQPIPEKNLRWIKPAIDSAINQALAEMKETRGAGKESTLSYWRASLN